MDCDFPADRTWSEAGPAPIDEVLEREYNLRLRHPEREAVYADFAERSAAFRQVHGGLLDEPYGDGPRARLDVFPAGNGTPILVFIHGGYWRTLDKSVFSFLAAPYVAAGVTVVMPNYDLVPAVALADIAGQMHRMLAWIRTEAASFGADPSRIVLSGHSAGGHLAALTALTDPPSGTGLRGVAAISGVFYLAPLLRTSVNRDARLTPAGADALSPLRLARETPAAPALPLLLLVGAEETTGFRQQSHEFLDAWRSRGRPGTLTLAPRRTHFTVLEAFADAQDSVLADVLAMLGTGSSASPPSTHRAI